jgi:hypothetical protein
MKTGPHTLRTVENESGNAKHENESRLPRLRRKREPTPSVPPKTIPSAQNMKTGTDAIGYHENETGCAKNEIETRRPPYRRKRARKCKT